MADMNTVIRTLAGRSVALDTPQQPPRLAKSCAGSGTGNIGLPVKLDMNNTKRRPHPGRRFALGAILTRARVVVAPLTVHVTIVTCGSLTRARVVVV